MRVLIIGGAGMVGRKLAERIASDGRIGARDVDEITLYDVVAGAAPPGARMPVRVLTGDLPAPGETDRLVAGGGGGRPDLIYHLAAIVSGEAEQEFEKGYRINMGGTLNLLESVRKAGHRPRLVFTSSLAVFGAPFPDQIDDEFLCAPLTSYGTQKAAGELFVSDYTRKGFVDGLSLRLPTICVRPGTPNKAASGFFSNIIREPLAGREAVLPVADSVRHWHASPRAAVGFLLHAATLDTARVGPRRALSLPGLSCTVGEQIAALEKVAGSKVARRIRRERDPFIETIVAGWPRNFSARRASELGFRAESSFEDIIRIHIEDELGGKIS